MSLKLKKKILILIPALNPTDEFINYINQLIKKDFNNIVIINDGSSKECDSIFNEIGSKKECHVIEHKVNEGKGKSIKDGLKYFANLKDVEEYSGIITADCDGQHLIKDIISIAKEMDKSENLLILGTRDFSKDNVPKKSIFGNKITSNVFKLLYGAKITDTQTGLRGISSSLVEQFIEISGDRYEYETNVLIDAILKKVKILEIPIDTVYIDDNSNSHFRPIHDSILIYWKILNSFIKYSAVSIISFIVDIAMFQIFLSIFNQNSEIKIIIATVLARIISSLLNFGLNKRVSFKSNKKISNTIIKYYILCLIQMTISALAVSGLYYLTNISETVIKIIVDTMLFILNYRIQRTLIFNR